MLSHHINAKNVLHKISIMLFFLIIIFLIIGYFNLTLPKNTNHVKSDNTLKVKDKISPSAKVKDITSVTANKAVLSPPAVINSIDKNFFVSSVFVGDSITSGISESGFLNNAKIAAKSGLTVDQAKNMVSTIASGHPSKVFILLGTNDIMWDITSSKYAEEYSDLVKSIKAISPDSKIYAQSIFPVTEAVKDKKPLLTIDKINEFNSALKNEAEKDGFKFLDTASIFTNSSGYLFSEITDDGIHLRFQYYGDWLNYLIKNAD